MNDFEKEYVKWLDGHKAHSSGERLRRLEEGHGEPEKLFLKNVWWPVVGTLEYLHPEYEVVDFKEGYRYIDYAYIRLYYKLAWEILGFGPHWRNIDRWKFGDDQVRQCDLVNDGWIVMPFAYDLIDKKARICQRIVQQTLGRLFGMRDPSLSHIELDCYEERIVRRMKQHELQEIEACDAVLWTGLEKRAARKILCSLVDKGLLNTDGNPERTSAYRLATDLSRMPLL